MAVSWTRFSSWMWGGKEKEPISNESSLNPSTDYGPVRFRETDSVKFTSKNLPSYRKVKRKWQSREERRIEKPCDDVVLIQSDDGVFLSGSESDGPDWSIGWVEPHGRGFNSDDEADDGFAVLVRCYRPGCKELVEGSNNQLLSAIKNLTSQLSSEGNSYMDWFSSIQNLVPTHSKDSGEEDYSFHVNRG